MDPSLVLKKTEHLKDRRSGCEGLSCKMMVGRVPSGICNKPEVAPGRGGLLLSMVLKQGPRGHWGASLGTWGRCMA